MDIRAALGAAVGAVATTELAARYLEPALPPHQLWYDTLPALRLEQMRRMRRSHGTVDVVFVGHSTVHSAVDPAVVLEEAGLPGFGYNAALHRGFFAVTGPWLSKAVIPLLRPKLVVFGCIIVDLNDNGPLLEETPALYSSSLLGRDDAIGTVGRWLALRSAAFRHHRLISHPRRLVRAFNHRINGTILPGSDRRDSRDNVGTWGQWTGFHGRSFHTTDAMYQHLAEGCMGNYECGGTQLEVVEHWIRQTQELVPHVVLAMMPLSRQFATLAPRGQADLDDATVAFRDLASGLGVPFLEVDANLDDETDFADMAHCNDRGMAKFSKALGRELGELIRTIPGGIGARGPVR